MSRDPNDPGATDPFGVPIDPRALHKYLYAGGDPVNAVDPSGRGAILEEAWKDVVAAAVITSAVVPFGACIFKEVKEMGQVLSNPKLETRYLDYTNIVPNILTCVLDFYKETVSVPFLDIWKRLGF